TIFPIFRLDKSNRYFLVGTGFYIAGDGIFVTAKHVVEEVVDNGDELKVFHMEGENWVMRKMAFYTPHPEADIAVGVLERLMFKTSGTYLENKYSVISVNKPEINDRLYTYTYPKTEIKYEEKQQINIVPTQYDGLVTDCFPDGRDRVMLPSACYQLAMGIVGGASGGPVFDASGKVVAINSTSYENDNITFVSCIQDLMPLNVYQNAPVPNSFSDTPVRVLVKKI
ncbi:trypsin-like peptidase domain-containing protein, partial [Vibrio vulnificus]|nr:trypsin-like peptidase domain-containing protein [Vibrio vulnificus]